MNRLVYPTRRTSNSPRPAAVSMDWNSGVFIAAGSSIESGPDQPDLATVHMSSVSMRPNSASARSCIAFCADGPYLSSCRPELSRIQRAARSPRI
jgi:hypothetical protein